MHGAPPKGIPNARLFRLLLARPRPWWPLSLRVAAAPETPLHVVALRGVEVEEALDAAKAHGGEDAHFDRFKLEVVARALHTPDGRAFGSADEPGALTDTEGEALVGAVLEGLAIVSPTYARSTVAAWEAALRDGARAGANLHEAVLLGGCVQHGWAGLTPRPDLYFGAPLADLTDGQMMAYRAAREVVKAMQSK